jgi:hypothetical protein
MNSLWILKVTLTGWGDYELTAYKPIPLRRYDPNNIYTNIVGPTEIRYSSIGEPSYSSASYVLYGTASNGISKPYTTGITLFIPQTSTEENLTTFVPTLSTSYKLQPLACYVEDAPEFGIQFSSGGHVVWT